MSTIIMSKCWGLPMSTSQKMVLISLADNANDEGYCWPGLESICRRACLSERAVQSAFKALEALGVLEREHRYKRSTVYRVTPERFRVAGQPKASGEDAAGESPECPKSQDLPRSSCTAASAGQEISPADDCILTRRSLHSDPQELRAEPSIEPSIRTAIPAGAGARTHAHTRVGPSQEDDIESGRVQVAFDVPSWVPYRPWLDYIHARSQANLPTTPGAKRELLRQLHELIDQGQDPTAVLREALASGWKRLYPVGRRAGQAGQGGAGIGTDAALAAIKAKHKQREQEQERANAGG